MMPILRKHFWLSYSGLLLLLGYGQLFRLVLVDSGSLASRFLPPLAATIIVAGIAGFKSGKGLFIPHIWRTLFKILMLASAVLMIMMGWWFFSGDGTLGTLLCLTLALVLLSPAEHILYRYSFESPQLWIKIRPEQD
jgi:hypothetical protein